MKTITVQAYQYHELNQKAKDNVCSWLDEYPFDYEDEDGNLITQYFIDMEEEDIQEHCESNEYLFSDKGEPIHHLEKEEL